MLRPIPRQILSQTMVLHIPTSCDSDYNVQYENIVVERVHLQDDFSILKELDNTITNGAIIITQKAANTIYKRRVFHVNLE